MSVERPRPLVAGNWKMNGLKASAGADGDPGRLYAAACKAKVDLAICPPATLIAPAGGQGSRDRASPSAGRIAMPGHPEPSPAISRPRCWPMPARPACSSAIPSGGSTTRETDADVCAKAVAAHRAGLDAIVCVGETRDEREAGQDPRRRSQAARGSIPADPTATTSSSPMSPSGRSAPA